MGKYAKETWVGFFVFLGLVCIGYLTIKLGKMEVFSRDSYTVGARFASITGLRVGADVEISGVPVGKVSGIRLDQESGIALVDLTIKNEVELATDAIASVKTSGLIGDKYVRITLGGSSKKLKPGDVITETESAVDLEELISKYVFGRV